MSQKIPIILLFLFSLLMLPWQMNSARAGNLVPYQQSPTQEPVVHAVLFWMKGCSHCAAVMEKSLPAIQSQYGSRLEIQLVEVVTTENVDRLYRIGSAYGLSKDEIGVPLLLLGSDVLTGSVEIPEKLPSLVERYLKAGGSASPDLEKLALTTSSTNPAEGEQFSGMSLGWIIMIGMLVALLYTTWIVIRAFQGKPLTQAPNWVNAAILILAFAGLSVALYLTIIESTSIPAVCGPIGDCNSVQQSPYARLFGIIPVGLLGALGYLAILLTWVWRQFRKDKLAGYAPLAIFGMSLFGTLFSVYLTYLELLVIKAVCIWCLSSAVIITLLMLLSLPPATQWLAAAEEEEQ